MVVRGQHDGNQRRHVDAGRAQRLLPSDKIGEQIRLPDIGVAGYELSEHQPDVVADLRSRPAGPLGGIPNELQRFAVPQSLQLDDTQHVQRIDVIGLLVQRAPVKGFGSPEGSRAMRGERIIARPRRPHRRDATAMLEPLATPAGARRIPVHDRTLTDIRSSLARQRADDSTDCQPICGYLSASRQPPPTQKARRIGRAFSGRGASCARDFGAAGYSPHASISVMRVQLASAWVTLMRIRSVGNGVNVTLRLTRLLPATVASVTQLVPLYPCTWKSVMPRSENVVVSVGSTGAR